MKIKFKMNIKKDTMTHEKLVIKYFKDSTVKMKIQKISEYI